MNTAVGSTRITITVPENLMGEVKEATENKSISGFFVEAARSEIARIKREAALRRFEKLPPAFTDINDSVEYVNTLREESEDRLKRLNV